eukprot:4631707-Prymnesium_polylepis.1
MACEPAEPDGEESESKLRLQRAIGPLRSPPALLHWGLSASSSAQDLKVVEGVPVGQAATAGLVRMVAATLALGLSVAMAAEETVLAPKAAGAKGVAARVVESKAAEKEAQVVAVTGVVATAAEARAAEANSAEAT